MSDHQSIVDYAIAKGEDSWRVGAQATRALRSLPPDPDPQAMTTTWLLHFIQRPGPGCPCPACVWARAQIASNPE